MASKEVLDFAKLLAPISADKPAGVDPRSDPSPNSPYYKIKGARNDARAAERQAVGKDDAEPPDWKVVHQLCTKALAEQAKDLEITAYLIESLLRLEGFAGLRDGFRLARELAEKFWDKLYPLPDATPDPGEHPLLTRMAPLVGLNGEDAEGTLITPIARVALTDPSSGDGQFALAQYNEANSLKKITDAKILQRKLDAGAVSLEKFQKAVAEGKPQFYLNLVDDLTASAKELDKLCEVLDKRSDGHGPPKSNIQTALTNCIDVVKQVAAEKLKVVPAEAAPKSDGTAAAKPGSEPAAKTAVPAVLQTREQALESLQKVADFYRRTEPHSPMSYALDQVVRWGKMPLPELWTELIAEEAPRKSLFSRLGIKQPTAGK